MTGVEALDRIGWLNTGNWRSAIALARATFRRADIHERREQRHRLPLRRADSGRAHATQKPSAAERMWRRWPRSGPRLGSRSARVQLFINTPGLERALRVSNPVN